MTGCHVQPEQMFDLIWGYNAGYAERVSNLNAANGGNILSSTIVPTGEVWVACSLVAFNDSRNPTTIFLGLDDRTTWYNLTRKAGAGVGLSTEWSGMAVAPAGSRFYAYITGCVAGDHIYLEIVGYKMKLTQ